MSLSSRCIVRTDLTRYRTMRSFCLHFAFILAHLGRDFNLGEYWIESFE